MSQSPNPESNQQNILNDTEIGRDLNVRDINVNNSNTEQNNRLYRK